MEYTIPNKYLQFNPFTCPEYYNFSSDISSNKIKSLYISSDKDTPPLIIVDYYSSIIETIFKDVTPAFLNCLNNYRIYYNPYSQLLIDSSNYIATMLIRYDQILLNGLFLSDSISGDVVIFGSVNPSNGYIDNRNYSVPYELIEQSARLYANYSNFKDI